MGTGAVFLGTFWLVGWDSFSCPLLLPRPTLFARCPPPKNAFTFAGRAEPRGRFPSCASRLPPAGEPGGLTCQNNNNKEGRERNVVPPVLTPPVTVPGPQIKRAFLGAGRLLGSATAALSGCPGVRALPTERGFGVKKWCPAVLSRATPFSDPRPGRAAACRALPRRGGTRCGSYAGAEGPAGGRTHPGGPGAALPAPRSLPRSIDLFLEIRGAFL